MLLLLFSINNTPGTLFRAMVPHLISSSPKPVRPVLYYPPLTDKRLRFRKVKQLAQVCSVAHWFSTEDGVACLPEDICQCLQVFFIVTTGQGRN